MIPAPPLDGIDASSADATDSSDICKSPLPHDGTLWPSEAELWLQYDTSPTDAAEATHFRRASK